MQSTAGVWTDVTMPILNYGIGGLNLDGQICGADPTPDAIVRIQRLRDNGGAGGGGCNYNAITTGITDATNWWPNVLFDPREGLQRNIDPMNTNVKLGGLMHYVAIDVANLARWFQGAVAPFNAGNNGVNAIKDNGGFTVYFSDRRNNRNAANQETGEYGWEDFVNSSNADGAPNNNTTVEAGEDVNANSIVDIYGGIPSYNGTSGTPPPGAAAPLNSAARPTTALTRGQAQVNRAILFRRALKLINGDDIRAQGVTGLTVVSENPVYVQGDWNAGGASFATAHSATAIIADAVTLLSSAWTDTISFTQPYNAANRPRAAQNWYRVAVIAGKGMSFPWPGGGAAADFGTDGGAHNFLRYLEGNPGRWCDAQLPRLDRDVLLQPAGGRHLQGRHGTVYGAPTRAYNFDINFLTPALLPPNTPVFRDMNAVGFSQELRPGR